MRTACRMTSVLLAVLIVGCGKKPEPTGSDPTPGPQPPPTTTDTDKSKAQGVWKVVKLEWPEKGDDPRPPQEILDGATITVGGDRVTVEVKGDQEPLYVIFTEDVGKSPRQVNFIATENKDSREPRKHEIYGVKDGKQVVVDRFTDPPLQAIYKFEGDTLVVALPGDPQVARPTEFKPGVVPHPKREGRTVPVVVLHLKKK